MEYDVSKCNLACPKSDTCGHALSTRQPFYDFKHICKNESMYFEHFDGLYKDIKEKQEVKVEETDSIECGSDRGQDNLCDYAEGATGSEG